MDKKDMKEKKVKNKAEGKEKSGKKMTPLEKARIARQKGKSGKGDKKATKKTWLQPKAPADFKPFDLHVVFQTEKDGLIGSLVKAVRYKGRYDPEADDKKKFNMATYDVPTLVGIAARLSTHTYKPAAPGKETYYPVDIAKRNETEKFENANGEKKQRLVYRKHMRFPPLTTFSMLLRVGKKSATGTVSVSLKKFNQAVEVKGRIKSKALDKKDPLYRRMGRVVKMLPPAFKNVQLPPARTKKSKKEEIE